MARQRNTTIAPFFRRCAILLVLFPSSLVVHVVDGHKHNVAWRSDNANEEYEHKQNGGTIHGEGGTPWRHFLIPNDRRPFLMQSQYLMKHYKNNNKPTSTKGHQMKWKGRDKWNKGGYYGKMGKGKGKTHGWQRKGKGK